MSEQAPGAIGGAVAGLAGPVTGVGVAELVATGTGPTSAPAIALDGALVSRTPEAVKQFAISHFGENDKTVLLVGVYAVLERLAAAAGALGVRSGRQVLAAGLASGGLRSSRSPLSSSAPGASFVQAAPSLTCSLVAAGAYLGLLRGRDRGAEDGQAWSVGAAGDGEGRISRGRVLLGAGSSLAAGAGAYAFGRAALAHTYNAFAFRAAVWLPRPASTVASVEGTGFDVEGLAPYITSTCDFYRVDTALVVPQRHTERYRLRVHGMVDCPANFSFADLLELVGSRPRGRPAPHDVLRWHDHRGRPRDGDRWPSGDARRRLRLGLQLRPRLRGRELLRHDQGAGRLGPAALVGVHKTIEGATVSVADSGTRFDVNRTSVVCPTSRRTTRPSTS